MKSILESGSPLGFFNKLLAGADELDNLIKKFKYKEIDITKPYLGGSISNYAKDLIMTFPVLCDNTINPEIASMISRANERYIVTLFELLFASAQFNANNGVEVIRSIHNNIKTDYDLEDYIDAMNNYLANDESVSAAALREATEKMVSQLKQKQHSFPTNSFSENSISGYNVINNDGNVSIREARARGRGAYDSHPEIDGFTFNPGDPLYGIPPAYVPNAKFDQYSINYPGPGDWEQQMRKAQYYNDLYFKSFNAEMQRKQYELNKDRYDKQDKETQDTLAKRYQTMQQTRATTRDMVSKQLVDSEVKKSNEMAPTVMVVSYNEYNPDTKDFIGVKSFAAGVKSRLIPTDPYDIIDHVVAKNKTKMSFLNLIRATTGEIKFMKDFILCIDQAKIDAKNGIKKGESAAMWRTLENLASKNTWNKLRRSGNDASAITVLVINQETVNVLKKQYDFDLEKVKNAKMMLDSFNLLGIIIVDESIEAVKFLYRGNDRFEQQAFSYLEKEDRDKSYKKIINLMGQSGRF